jgi:hypothetical protein
MLLLLPLLLLLLLLLLALLLLVAAPDECVDLLGLDVVHVLHRLPDLLLVGTHVNQEHLDPAAAAAAAAAALQQQQGRISTTATDMTADANRPVACQMCSASETEPSAASVPAL